MLCSRHRDSIWTKWVECPFSSIRRKGYWIRRWYCFTMGTKSCGVLRSNRHCCRAKYFCFSGDASNSNWWSRIRESTNKNIIAIAYSYWNSICYRCWGSSYCCWWSVELSSWGPNLRYFRLYAEPRSDLGFRAWSGCSFVSSRRHWTRIIKRGHTFIDAIRCGQPWWYLSTNNSARSSYRSKCWSSKHGSGNATENWWDYG